MIGRMFGPSPASSTQDLDRAFAKSFCKGPVDTVTTTPPPPRPGRAPEQTRTSRLRCDSHLILTCRPMLFSFGSVSYP